MSDAAIPATVVQAAPEAVARPAAPAVTRCVSCGHPRAETFCPGCGQPTPEGRFTVRRVVTHLVTDAFDLQRGLLFTVARLARAPGRAIREYVSGRTVRYTNPVKFFLIMSALSALAYLTFGLDAMRATSEALYGSAMAEQVANEPFMEFYNQHMTLVMAAGVPVTAAFSLALFRGVAGYNYAEHLIFNLYVYALQSLGFAALITMSWLLGIAPIPVLLMYMAASVGFYAWAAAGFFGVRPRTAAVRGVAVLLGSYLAYMTLGGVLGVVFAVATNGL